MTEQFDSTEVLFYTAKKLSQDTLNLESRRPDHYYRRSYQRLRGQYQSH